MPNSMQVVCSPPLSAEKGFDITHHGCAGGHATALSAGFSRTEGASPAKAGAKRPKEGPLPNSR